MITTEIVAVPLKAGVDFETAGSKDQQAWQEIIATFRCQAGLQAILYGRYHESPDTLQLVLDWENIEAHHAFMKSPDNNPFTHRFAHLTTTTPTIVHTNFLTSFEHLASTAPIVEMISLYFEASVDTQSWEKTWNEFVAKASENAKGYYGSAAGWVVEELEHEKIEGKAKLFAAALGWDSIDAHMAFRDTQTFKDSIHLLRDNAKALAMHHTKFNKA